MSASHRAGAGSTAASAAAATATACAIVGGTRNREPCGAGGIRYASGSSASGQLRAQCLAELGLIADKDQPLWAQCCDGVAGSTADDVGGLCIEHHAVAERCAQSSGYSYIGVGPAVRDQRGCDTVARRGSSGPRGSLETCGAAHASGCRPGGSSSSFSTDTFRNRLGAANHDHARWCEFAQHRSGGLAQDLGRGVHGRLSAATGNEAGGSSHIGQRPAVHQCDPNVFLSAQPSKGASCSKGGGLDAGRAVDAFQAHASGQLLQLRFDRGRQNGEAAHQQHP